MNPEHGIASAIRVLLATSAEPDGNPTTVSALLRDQLAGEGFSDALCEKLATFVPLAFSRDVLRREDFEIDYPSYYVATAINSRSEKRHPLSEDALYTTAQSIAARWEADEEKVRIASFSGEYQALTNLLNDAKARGSRLEQAAVSSPYVVYTSDSGPLEEPSSKPWWKFW